MKYRYLGNSGLAVSTICIGTMTFGQKDWGSDINTSHRILDLYKESGGNFIDTSDHYTNTLSEQIIGEWLVNQSRDNFVIATKCGFNVSNNINSRGLSRKHLIKACEDSLTRLKTDYIDLYQIYGFDPQTPMEETLSTLDLLIKQGKIRYIGLSNYPAWKVVKIVYLANKYGFTGFVSGQFLYNILKRDVEVEIVPACDDQKIGILCWSPLSGGMLTGKYIMNDNPPKDSRIALRPDITGSLYTEWYTKSIIIVNRIKAIASKNGQTPATIALAWLLKRHQVKSIIVGARKQEQIVENCKAGEWVLPEDDFAELNKISEIKMSYPYDWCKSNNGSWYDGVYF